MTIDPSREEWLAVRERVVFADHSADADARTEAALGPCPPEPAPEPWQLAGMGSLAVGVAVPSTDARIVFRNQPIAQLNADEADAMAAALVAHAWYAREQEASDEPTCGRLLVRRDSEGRDQPCPRPVNHPGVCRPHRVAGDDD